MVEINRNRGSISQGFAAEEDDTRRRRRRGGRQYRYIGFGVVVFALCFGSFVVVVFREELLRTAMWIKGLSTTTGGTAYTCLVAVWLLALLPTSLLEIAGGFIFGMWIAALCSTIGKMIGSFVSFAIGRRYKDWVREKILEPASSKSSSSSSSASGDPPGYVAGLELAMRARPFSTCLALRLAYVPEAVQNYVPAVLDAPFAQFGLATGLGSSCYALLWAKLGSELSDAQDIIKDGWSPEKIAFSVVGLASLVVVLGLVHWNTKRLIRRAVAMNTHQDPSMTTSLTRAMPDDVASSISSSSQAIV